MAAIPATRTATLGKVGSRAKARANAGAVVVARLFVFVMLSAIAYLTSSMAGQVMVEKARREGIAAQRRATEARRAESGLRARINELTGFSNLDEWAVAHGFVASEQPFWPSQETTRVAKLDRP